MLGAEVDQLSPYEVTIAPSAVEGDYVLRITLHGEPREFRDRDCRTLFRSAVVVAAASVKPDLAADLPHETPPPNKAQASEPSAGSRASESPRTAPPAARPPSPRRAAIAAGAGVIAGLVPGVAPLFELGGLAQDASWGAWLSLRHATLSSAEAEGGRGVEVRAFGARAAAAYSPTDFARLSLGLEVDLMVGRGTGVTTPLSDTAWSFAPTLELAAILLNIDRLRLEVALQGRWAPLRPRFHIAGYGDAYRVPAFGAAGLFRVAYFLF